jgi:integrase
LTPDVVTHGFSKIARLAGFKGLRLHDMRHTHATLMLQQGVHPKVVSERLGHANIQMTLDTYSHVLPGLQEAAALRFDTALTSHEASPTTVGNR